MNYKEIVTRITYNGMDQRRIHITPNPKTTGNRANEKRNQEELMKRNTQSGIGEVLALIFIITLIAGFMLIIRGG